MNHEELRELQLVQYDILKEIDRVCKNNQITYYLAYGTLLGAIRHKAFIPWDDDIDITMTRKEHTSFLAVLSQLKEGYTVKHICYSDIQYASLTRVFFGGCMLTFLF